MLDLQPIWLTLKVAGLAITADCRREKAARQFVAFVLSPKGQHILAEFGFRNPDA